MQLSDSLSNRFIALTSTDSSMLLDESRGIHPITCIDGSVVVDGFLCVALLFVAQSFDYQLGLLISFCFNDLFGEICARHFASLLPPSY